MINIYSISIVNVAYRSIILYNYLWFSCGERPIFPDADGSKWILEIKISNQLRSFSSALFRLVPLGADSSLRRWDSRSSKNTRRVQLADPSCEKVSVFSTKDKQKRWKRC